MEYINLYPNDSLRDGDLKQSEKFLSATAAWPAKGITWPRKQEEVWSLSLSLHSPELGRLSLRVHCSLGAELLQGVLETRPRWLSCKVEQGCKHSTEPVVFPVNSAVTHRQGHTAFLPSCVQC